MGLYRKKNNTEVSQIAGNVDYSEINDLKQNLTKLQTYSTNEQIVGKWIDGRDIYKKVVTNLSVRTGSNTGGWTTLCPLYEADMVIKSTLFMADQGTYYPRNTRLSSGSFQTVSNGLDETITTIIFEYVK